MSEKVFKPVADAFALIHAGGEPYQWTTNAVEAVAWLNENSKYTVKEYVSLDRYQSAVSGDIAALQKKLDAANSELARYSMPAGQADQFAAEARAVRKALGFAENAEDVAPIDLLEKVAGLRAEGADMFAALTEAAAEEEYGDDDISSEFLHYSARQARLYAAQLRAETDTTSSQYESLAGGK